MKSDRSGIGAGLIALLIVIVMIAVIAGVFLLTIPGNENPEAPGAPGGFHASIHGDSITLSWNASASNGADVSSYKIYRGTSPGSESLLIWLGVVLSYEDTSVTGGHTYYYQISAMNSVGESAKSNTLVTFATVPSAPSNLSAILDYAQVTLTWSAPANDGGTPIVGYKIFRSDSSGVFGNTQLATVSSLYYNDSLSGLTGTRYYVVKAYNGVGDSPASNQVTVPAPMTPTITMTYQKTATDTYVFTVAGITRNDVKASDITVRVLPSTGLIVIPQFSVNVQAGDTITLVGTSANTQYTLTLVYVPTNSASYQITWTTPELVTPTVTMTYQKTAANTYTFTVAGVTRNDIKMSDLSILIVGGTATAVGVPTIGTGATGNLIAGDQIVVSSTAPSTVYTLTLQYLPTAGAAYQVTWTAT